MTHKKKIEIIVSLFEKAMNLTEDSNVITQFKRDFIFYTKEIMPDDADVYLSEAEKIEFSTHLKQLETTSTINLQIGGFQTAKEEYCRLIEKKRATIELDRGNLLLVKPINTIALTIRDILIAMFSSTIGGYIIHFINSNKTALSIIIPIIIFIAIILTSIRFNLAHNKTQSTRC